MALSLPAGQGQLVVNDKIRPDRPPFPAEWR